MSSALRITEKLSSASEILRAAGVAEPRREAASLLAFALKQDKTFLIAHPEYELQADEEQHFAEYLNRRAAREPFQYIVGKQEFYGLDFEVTPDVLIPRPETEMLVEKSVEILSEIPASEFCEIGIGSGAIAVAILHNLHAASGIGSDISERALEITRKNAERHGVEDRLELCVSDVFSNLPDKKFDLIVSNPPYVPAEDLQNLQHEVRDFEPHIALSDGADGLSIAKRIVEDSPRYLKPGGWLLMEIGFSQAAAVREWFNVSRWQYADILPDLQGIPRMVAMRLRGGQKLHRYARNLPFRPNWG